MKFWNKKTQVNTTFSPPYRRSSAVLWDAWCSTASKAATRSDISVWETVIYKRVISHSQRCSLGRGTGSRLPAVLWEPATHTNARGRPFPWVRNQNDNDSLLKILSETYTEAMSKGCNLAGASGMRLWGSLMRIKDAGGGLTFGGQG